LSHAYSPKVFNVNEAQFINFHCCCLCFWCHVEESLPNPMPWIHFAYVFY
jgi:hypothetical protein